MLLKTEYAFKDKSFIVLEQRIIVLQSQLIMTLEKGKDSYKIDIQADRTRLLHS